MLGDVDISILLNKKAEGLMAQLIALIHQLWVFTVYNQQSQIHFYYNAIKAIQNCLAQYPPEVSFFLVWSPDIQALSLHVNLSNNNTNYNNNHTLNSAY